MAVDLIFFPGKAMVASAEGREAMGRDSHAVIEQAKAAGFHVFGGRIADPGTSPLVRETKPSPSRRRGTDADDPGRAVAM